MIADIQRRLAHMGFDVGAADGIIGRRTADALNMLMDAYAALAADLGGDDDETLISELLRDEGFVPHAYQDHLGYWTIGVGRLIDKRRGGGITRSEAEYLLRSDIIRKRGELDAALPWWRNLDPVRQRAVQNMAFQIGAGGLKGATFDLIRDGRYSEAADRLAGWKWASQTPERALRVIGMIRTGRAL